MTSARHATAADVPQIMDLLAMMHAESRYARWPIDAAKLGLVVHTLIGNDDGCCIVAHDGDTLTGVMLGAVQPFFFSRARFATELLLYVTPMQRGSWAAIRMAQAFIDWAKASDAVEIQAGVTAGIANPAADGFYSKLGFEQLGHAYAKGLDHVRP